MPFSNSNNYQFIFLFKSKKLNIYIFLHRILVFPELNFMIDIEIFVISISKFKIIFL
jgi:hypothetical protein